jgi:hypothetical protein
MSDTFVPLAPLVKSAAGNGFTPLEFRPGALSAAAAPPAAPTPPVTTRALQNCADPKVTLQRQGDQVTAIRVECGCGEVIELNCVY